MFNGPAVLLIDSVNSNTAIKPTLIARGAIGQTADIVQVQNNAQTTIFNVTAAGNVGIGTLTPQAGLDVGLTGTFASAIIIPRDTTTNRPGGANGMLRYNTTANKFEAFENGTWTNMIGVPTSFPLIANPTGSVAAPAYSFSGSTSTGMYSGAANNLDFATNGVARLSVDQLGNIGIGTTAPGATLEIKTAGTSPSDIYLWDQWFDSVYRLHSSSNAANQISGRFGFKDDTTWGTNFVFESNIVGAASLVTAEVFRITSDGHLVGLGLQCCGRKFVGVWYSTIGHGK